MRHVLLSKCCVVIVYNRSSVRSTILRFLGPVLQSFEDFPIGTCVFHVNGY